MKTSLKSVCFFAIIAELGAAEPSDDVTPFVNLAENVRKYFLSSSIIVVYDERVHGFESERIHLEAIKAFSARGSMSQAISYDVYLRDPNGRVRSRRDNVLYSLLIVDAQSLERAINATGVIDTALHPYLLWFAKSSDFDCSMEPIAGRRHFFRLRMDTKMTAKCHGQNTLKRYHSVRGDRTEIRDFAEWSPAANGLVFANATGSRQVETDMKGITLRVAKRDDSVEMQNENMAKFFGSLAAELRTLANFRTVVTAHESGLGYYDDASHEWTGLIGLVSKGQADIGMFLFSMSNARLNSIDFAAPLDRSRYYLYARLPDAKLIRWSAYFEAFDVYTWIAMCISILLSAVLMSLVEGRGRFLADFFAHFLDFWGIYCQQGPASSSTNTSTRIVYFSILMSSLVLNNIYSATITTYITLLSATLPFSTYEQFKRDTSYQVIVLKSSRDENLITTDEDPYLSPLKPRLKISCDLPVSPYEGFQQACATKTVYYADEMSFDGMKKPPCQLGRIDMDRVDYQSIILAKNSPYTKTISYFIKRLREYGVLDRLKNEYFYKFTEIPENKPDTMSFEEVLPILVVWIIGVAVALIMWLLELMTFYFHPFFRLMLV